MLGPGDAFGELALVGGGKRTATVVAAEPVETLSLLTSHGRQLPAHRAR